jgi:ABC-2 type transport system ATP-binding protein
MLNKKPLVEVLSLQKSYGSVPVVKGIDFKMFEGEVLGLLGPNGAGKTTTVLMLAAYLVPDKGSIRIDNKDLSNPKDIKEIRSNIGYVPQEISLYGDLNSVQNLQFFGKLYNVKSDLLKVRIDEALELVGLSDKRKQLVKHFSGGMQRRLNIAVALLHRPKLVILDEPTTGIDPQSRNRIFDIVKDLKKNNTSVLYITHYMEEAQLLCDRVAVMDDGKIIAIDTVSSLLQTVKGSRILNVEIANWDEAYKIHLKKQYGASEVTYRDGVLSVHIEDAKSVIPRLINELYNMGCDIKKIDIVEPDLQQVFLQLTGKKLRD